MKFDWELDRFIYAGDVRSLVLPSVAFIALVVGHYLGSVISPVFSFVFVFIFFVFYFLLGSRVGVREAGSAIFLFFFFVVVFIYWALGGGSFYGDYKVSALFFSFFLPSLIFLAVKDKLLFVKMLSFVIVLLMFFYGFFVFVYKVYDGRLFQRTMMGLNGPIVFSRLMAMGLVLSVFLFLGRLRLFVCLFFLFMILVSFSKGPLLSLIVVLMFFLRLKHIAWLAPCFFILVFLNVELFGRYINFYNDFMYAALAGDWRLIGVGVNEGSIGERLDSFFRVSEVNFDVFFGAGIGMWSSAFGSPHLYPHNLLLELYAEFGLVFFVLFSISLFVGFFLVVMSSWRSNGFFALSLFFFLSSLFSGSFVDARYFFFFFVVAVVVSKLAGDSSPGSVAHDLK